MTQDDIIRMARSVANPETEDPVNDGLITLTIGEMESFVALVAAAERDACAKVCEKLRDEDGYEVWNTECAAAIRARSQQ